MRRTLPFLLPLLAAGCGLPQRPAGVPGPVAATVAAPAAEALDRVARAMREAGLQPEATPAGLRAEVRGAARQDWAGCRRLLISDYNTQFVRSDWAEPGARDLEVTVAARQAGAGSEVTVAAATTATYRDIYRNLPVRARCPSTGALERQLLAAAGATG